MDTVNSFLNMKRIAKRGFEESGVLECSGEFERGFKSGLKQAFVSFLLLSEECSALNILAFVKERYELEKRACNLKNTFINGYACGSACAYMYLITNEETPTAEELNKLMNDKKMW